MRWVAVGAQTRRPQARIEIVTRKPNQVLMNLDMQVLVRRSDDAGLTYEASSYGASANAANTEAFKSSLLEALNAARAQAGAPPLALETNQSRTDERLVPHFFEGMFNSQDAMVETVALGLLAGWDVGGMIRDGGIFSGVVTGSRNPGRWLTHSLESPLGRWVLLDPGMSRIAVGVGALEPSGARRCAKQRRSPLARQERRLAVARRAPALASGRAEHVSARRGARNVCAHEAQPALTIDRAALHQARAAEAFVLVQVAVARKVRGDGCVVLARF